MVVYKNFFKVQSEFSVHNITENILIDDRYKTIYGPVKRECYFCRVIESNERRLKSSVTFLPPANEVCEGYVFTGVCLSTGGGVHGCSRGGMRGCSRGACVVAHRGGVHGCSQERMHGCSRRGHTWLLTGGMRGCSGGVRVFFPDEVRSMSGRYASYWNAFLLSMSSGGLDW